MNNNKKNFLDNKPNQPSKFKTKNWVEVNDKQNGVCNIGSQVKFKTSVLRSSLRDYNDMYNFLKEVQTQEQQQLQIIETKI